MLIRCCRVCCEIGVQRLGWHRDPALLDRVTAGSIAGTLGTLRIPFGLKVQIGGWRHCVSVARGNLHQLNTQFPLIHPPGVYTYRMM
jgi:hypothetical protein